MLKKYYVLPCLTALAVFVLDQASKLYIVQNVATNTSVTVLPGVFDLVNIRNRGAAFGFLNRSDIEWQFWLFLGVTFIAVTAIFALLHHYRQQNDRILTSGLGLVLGGAIGNMWDRVRLGAVVDFLDFYWQNIHWPAFNVADTAICIGVGLTCLALHKADTRRRQK